MQAYTLKLSENSNKAKALLNYLRTLDFIEVTKTNDWYNELNSNQKASIEKGIEDLNSGNTYSDEDVREYAHLHILKAQSK